ncbi:Stem cell self-renewal Piwi [Fusarium heterosporum]|uniref:Stem cell self-renewal Piwi n=1 Tax=Fusarium heterosporum TaxID=42747 RepID=A0A8H5WLX2_FUSHE|nr:Stem cell self-renewal Piwi [Fusarium heterosporum]
MSMPRDFTVNGIGRLGITVVSAQGFDPLQENTLEFTGLAFAIHAGLSLLEKPEGRRTLQNVGLTIANEWAKRKRGFQFGGDINQMPRYVDEFLRAIRADFPRVMMSDVGGHDVIAQAKRTPGWDGNLFQYLPKKAAGIYYNKTRVSQMATAASQASDAHSAGKKMSTRFRTFLFMFAVATSHELTHLFVGYLAQGQDIIGSYTPPEVSYLNYNGIRDRNGLPVTGESGRWLESRLFGGSIEFYRDVSDDNGQAGIPHILDSNALAIKIHPNCRRRIPYVSAYDNGSAFDVSTETSQRLTQLGVDRAERTTARWFFHALAPGRPDETLQYPGK